MRNDWVLFVFAALTPLASAQYSTSAADNYALSTSPSDQDQPKVVRAQDRGVWVSWLDGGSSGWDVRIQRLDANGYPVFQGGGLLVADRSFSSTQDYGLALASNGDALVAYRADAGGATVIEAARVSAAGGIEWRTIVGAAAGSVAAPSIAAVDDGEAVVGWTVNSSVRLQGLTAAGAPRWGAGTLLTPQAGSYRLGNVCASGSRGAVASIVHRTGGPGSPRHLMAQRFDDQGSPLWGVEPLLVFNGPSIQLDALPECHPYGPGGAAIAWSTSGPSPQCFVQTISEAGQPNLILNGAPVSTNTTRGRTDPSLLVGSFGSLFVFWRETSGSQSGVYGQRLDAIGSARWGAEGVALVPVGAGDIQQVRAARGFQFTFGGAAVCYTQSLSGTNSIVRAVSVDNAGATVLGPTDISTAPGSKANLEVTTVGSPPFNGWRSVAVWSDGRTDEGDIYVQNVDASGSLGSRFPVGSRAACSVAQNSVGAPAITEAAGTAVISQANLSLETTDLPSSTFGFYLTSRSGSSVPNPGGSQGNLCLGGEIGRMTNPGQILNSGAAGAFGLTVDLKRLQQPTGYVSALSGESWHFQAWYRDKQSDGDLKLQLRGVCHGSLSARLAWTTLEWASRGPLARSLRCFSDSTAAVSEASSILKDEPAFISMSAARLDIPSPSQPHDSRPLARLPRATRPLPLTRRLCPDHLVRRRRSSSPGTRDQRRSVRLHAVRDRSADDRFG